jgi:hypothetical protein
MKRLHIVTGVIEAGAEAAMLALGAACWLASGDSKNRTARGLVSAMTLYNLSTAKHPRGCRHLIADSWHRVVAGDGFARGDGHMVRRLPVAQTGAR